MHYFDFFVFLKYVELNWFSALGNVKMLTVYSFYESIQCIQSPARAHCVITDGLRPSTYFPERQKADLQHTLFKTTAGL